MQLRPGERVLELGCGPGELTAGLLGRGAQVDAVDVSDDMLRDAMRRAPGASFEQADLVRYVPRRKYDAVLLSFVLHEPARVTQWLSLDLNAILRSNELSAVVDRSLAGGRARLLVATRQA